MDLIFEPTSWQAHSISVFVSTFLYSTLLASGFRLCHYYSFTVIRLFFRCFAQQNLGFCTLSLSLTISLSFVLSLWFRPSHQIKWQLNWRTFCAIWQALSGYQAGGKQAEKPAEEQRKAVLTMRTADVWYAAYTQSNKNHHEQQLIDAKLLKSSLINLPIIREHYVLIAWPRQMRNTQVVCVI